MNKEDLARNFWETRYDYWCKNLNSPINLICKTATEFADKELVIWRERWDQVRDSK
jgi:hypothetical protein